MPSLPELPPFDRAAALAGLQEAFTQLTDDELEVARMRILGIPYAEIAEELGMLDDEVEQLWKLARRKLGGSLTSKSADRELVKQDKLREKANRRSRETTEAEQARLISQPQTPALRAARLYRMLTLLGTGPQTRSQLLRRLKLDVRGFYRDLEALRALGIEVNTTGDETKYTLTGELDDALAKLPFPDPELNVRDVLQLTTGATAAHRKLKQRVNSFLNGPNGGQNKPR
jgi:DNA-binding CsgD family transcriptional regulator